jgi:hypothetical protein
MRYILRGFTHETGCRVFAFEGIADDHVRTQYKVSADLALTQKYGIRAQELPLLCRELLERRNEEEEHQSFTYTESEMRRNAELCAVRAADAAQKRKTPGKPTGQSAGAAWRGPHL